MTNEQALREALQELHDVFCEDDHSKEGRHRARLALIQTLQALALPITPPAAAPAPASTQDEPFGYFLAEPFGWADCAATDEGAIALYERPAAPAMVPLSDQQVFHIENEHPDNMRMCALSFRLGLRAGERAHGIGKDACPTGEHT